MKKVKKRSVQKRCVCKNGGEKMGVMVEKRGDKIFFKKKKVTKNVNKWGEKREGKKGGKEGEKKRGENKRGEKKGKERG